MRNVQKLLAAILLALVLGASAYAGDMDAPPTPPPPPPIAAAATGDIQSPTIPALAPGNSATPSAAEAVVDTRTLLFDLLYGVLSMY